MEEKKQYYSIGKMAKLCNVSPKQLRYYDDNGILSPALKDEDTLYRYYTDEQVREVLLLKELREMDISLKEISDIIAERDVYRIKNKLRECLERASDDVKSALNKYNRITELYIRMSEVADLLGKNDEMHDNNLDIKLVELPIWRVVFTRYESKWNVEEYFTIERRTELYKILDEFDIHPQSSLMAIFHGGFMHQFSKKAEDQKGDLEVLFTVDNVKDCPHTRKFGGFRAVTATHIGHYRGQLKTYHLMEEWAERQQLKISNVSIEEYVNSVTMTKDESQLVTRLYIPLQGSVI